MHVKWFGDDHRTQLLDEYDIFEGDGNLPAHDGTIHYDWAGGEAHGNNWSKYDRFGVEFAGYLNVPAGNYSFKLKSDDASSLKTDGH